MLWHQTHPRTKRNVLGSATAGKLLVKIDSKSDYDTIKGRFANRQIGVKSTRIGLAAIKKIKKYEAEIDPTLEEGDTAKVQLVDYLNEELNHRSNLMLRDRFHTFTSGCLAIDSLI